ncbi:MAG TPA: tol-pal system protein YbgF [Thermoanaerobaculia bacterium]|nr:tol-pal system protein YbgF [Thermoanaerobaculia bacterium]
MIRRLAPILLPVLLAACASSGDVRSVEDQIADLEGELDRMRLSASSKAEIEQLNRTLTDQTQSLLRSNAEMTARVGQIDERVQNAQGNLEQTNYRIDRLAQQVNDLRREIEALRSALLEARQPAPGTDPSQPPLPGAIPSEEITVAPPLGSAPDPLEVYAAAYRDYQRGQWDLAIEGFREFADQNPESDLADNAAYWIGESYFSQKKYPAAIQQFDEVITRHPRSDKVPAALLKKGYSYFETGERAQGIVQLQYVIHEHPASPEANLARQRLRALGIEPSQ